MFISENFFLFLSLSLLRYTHDDGHDEAAMPL